MGTVTLLSNSRNVPNQLTINDQEAHRGGEGSIFFTTDGRYVVKIYHHPSSDKQKLLQHVLDLGGTWARMSSSWLGRWALEIGSTASPTWAWSPAVCLLHMFLSTS